MGPRPRVLVFVCLVLSISISISLAASEGEGENDECGPIFCQSDLLSAVQRAGVFEDNKEFVDMPLRVSPEEVLDRFHAMPNQSDPDALRALVAECFDPPGSDLSPWIPEDWNPLPPSAFLASVRDTRLKALAVHVHEVWINLGKKISPSVYSRPERHTLLPLHHPHSIVAGGRFRETYYWDSFWILKGLLISGMFNSAQDLVENLLHLVKDHGFVPNGSRRYYLRRSQPPMLPQMVNELFASMKERDPEHAMGFLREALPLLDQEYQFWMQLGERAVAIQCEPGKFCRSVPQQQPASGTVVLNRFYTDQSYPRPESYMPDVQTASEIAEDGRPRLYRHLAAAAESGWDFSSRWMSDHQHLHSLITSEIIPTDLNAIMYRNELVLAHFHSLLQDSASAQQYHAAATRRHAAIKDLLWDSDHHRWGDYVLDDPDVRAVSGSPGRTTGVGVANFVPLWAKCHLPVPPLEDLLNSAHHFATSTSTSRPDHAQSQSPHSPTPIQFPPAEADAILAALNAAGLVMPGGAVTMAELPLPTYQQWDFPNAWPPLQYFLVEGLEYLGSPTASAMALHIAQSFVSSVSIGYLQTQHFLEKYDGRALGAPGHGGEYDLQVGFGWTNGVLLDLLASYGSRLSAPHQVGV